MALTQGLLDSYWRRYNQRRALTGLPSSYQEMRGTLDPIMESVANKDIQEARLRSDNAFRDRSLSIQEQAQRDQGIAGVLGGVGQLAMLPMAYSAGKNLGWWGSKAPAPTVNSPATVPPATPASPGAGSGGLLSAAPGAGGGGAPLLSAMNPAPSAAPLTPWSTGGSALPSAASESMLAGANWTTAPAAIGGDILGQTLGKPVSKLLGTDPGTTSDVMGVAGAFGAGMAFSGGNPIVGLLAAGGSLLSKLF